MEQINWIGVLIQVLSVLPFYLSIRSSKKQISNEIEKMKRAQTLENLTPAFEYVFKFLTNPNETLEGKNAKQVHLNFQKTLMMYGSKDAIKIFQTYMQLNYSGKIDPKEGLYIFTILAAQLRHDSTSDWISPLSFQSIRITDLNEVEFKEGVNEVIRKYGFRKELVQ